jgi:hypothetical protein
MNLLTGDDYEGREVLGSLKVDADSRNIEEIEVSADPEQFKPRKTAEEMAELIRRGLEFKEYDGMIKDMEQGSIVIDDLNQFEAEKTSRDAQTGSVLCRYQGKILHPETWCTDETAAQLRFRRALCRF